MNRSGRIALALSLLTVAGATADAKHADELQPLSKVIEPIRKRWKARRLSDDGYRQELLHALEGRRVRQLWQAGFDLAQTLPASGKIRLHKDNMSVENVDGGQALVTRLTVKGEILHIGSPVACQFGCCTYPLDRPKSLPVIVLRACFDQAGLATDLEVDTRIDSWQERQAHGVPEPKSEEVKQEETRQAAETQVTNLLEAARGRGWCTQPPDKREITEWKNPLAQEGINPLAESCYLSLNDSDPAQRKARRALGLKMWDTDQWSQNNGRFLSSYWSKQPGSESLVELLRLASQWDSPALLKSSVFSSAPAKFAQAMQRALIGRPELALWKQVWALKSGAAEPTASSVSIVDEGSGKVTESSWAMVTNQYWRKADIPLACYGDCCLIGPSPASPKGPFLTELCFDASGKVRSATITNESSDSFSRGSFNIGDFLLRQVQLAARKSRWSVASRQDACLPAAVNPQHAAAVFYCARRMDPDLTDYPTKQMQIWAHLDTLVKKDVMLEMDIANFRNSHGDFWTLRAKTPAERVIRKASLQPLAQLSLEGAWFWRSGAERRWKVATIKALPRRLTILAPLSCDGGCCDYKGPHSCGGDGPGLPPFLERACFDASGATTDLYVDELYCGESDEPPNSDWDMP